MIKNSKQNLNNKVYFGDCVLEKEGFELSFSQWFYETLFSLCKLLKPLIVCFNTLLTPVLEHGLRSLGIVQEEEWEETFYS